MTIGGGEYLTCWGDARGPKSFVHLLQLLQNGVAVARRQ